jgi:2-phosphosulfolactate phosphatase
MAFTSQSAFDVRCEWGVRGAEALAGCRTFIVVDVLSFSTCVAIATGRNVAVFPYRAKDEAAADFADRHQALLCVPRGTRYSLSPASMLRAPAGTRLVLPSPNGAEVALEAAERGHVLAGCLRSRAAVCAQAVALGGPIGVIPAGERWNDGTLRCALEDLLGAGAIAAMLPGKRSPEAASAVAVFESAAGGLSRALLSCSSGLELIERGFREDVELSAELDVDAVAPQLIDGAFMG